MSNININKASFLSISEALEISSEEDKSLDENEMLLQIERRVAELMEREAGLLMSYLYRLDIEESKINFCLDPKTPLHPYICLAQLIWERQKQRMKTKLLYSQKGSVEEGWEW